MARELFFLPFGAMAWMLLYARMYATNHFSRWANVVGVCSQNETLQKKMTCAKKRGEEGAQVWRYWTLKNG